MDRFTIQVILTHMHKSSMSIHEIFELQKSITKNITEHKVTAFLNELVDMGYAEKVGDREYEPTTKSLKRLEDEGIDKEFLFPK